MTTLSVNPVDGAWLFMESEETPMHVGVLGIFCKPRNAATDYPGRLLAQLRGHKNYCAPWNLRFQKRSGLRMLPRWVEVGALDLDYHVRHSALPAPGGERELGIMVSRLHSQALDRSRPLWEFHLIEGLERNRFAFYMKIHHALLENVTGVPTFLSGLSTDKRARNMPPPWVSALNGQANTGSSTEPLNRFANTVTGLPGTTLGLIRNAAQSGRTGSFPIPTGAPRSTLNRKINRQRRIATQRFELSRIDALAEATDSTVNEVLAYLCGTSLRRFFKEYNALPEESLMGVVPVSLRERGQKNPGNALAGLRVALGTDIGDPLRRLESVKTSMLSVRKDRESLPESAASAYSLMRSAPLFASQVPGVGRFVPPLFNLTTSMTSGSDETLYFNGAHLEAIYPISPLLQYSALSFDCVSYAGTLNIGITGARDTLPHLQRLAVYLGQAVSDLEEIISSKGKEQ